MDKVQRKSCILLLEDGSIFHGYGIGLIGTTSGEICFNTGITGYQEVYTDPSYYGQILVNTTSHIGNYGVLDAETESGSVKIKGLVVKKFSDIFSRIQAEGSLQKYLEEAKIVGISDIDTRKLVRHIREKGAMNAIISSEIDDIDKLKELLSAVPSMEGLELASQVSTKETYFEGNPDAPLKVAVLDLGIKRNILRNLTSKGCYCKVFPSGTSFEEMNSWNPDGFFISNGPGDPASTTYAVETVKEIIKRDIPVFGICLGHQIIALANGITTYKMHHGHRGLNHPVKNLVTGKCEITSQNHGFSVSSDSVKNNENVEITHINLNDGTVEGIKILGKKAFSVQYHPEAAPGPHDSWYLFDQFIALMGEAETV
ncbi:glutamine-hydrolyzing carbamoyl-phosphate synthase small subunit [Flexithrix dorotheae]|uniref:glutamine-hydrolyzing carbamoyl-phosphate synthase small subunit n=1 Tax=Flexithrix dorotheae TaxID=70993 RepID=UPI00037C6F50|nr:glutamine-hydrolyzing carbamoyl-phosphate synthase small subunit [Flexithrix dorotheae]